MGVDRQPRGIALAGAPVGVAQQARECRGESAGVAHRDQRALLRQGARDVRAVELLGPGEHRQAQRCRLEQVVAADRHQAAADEGDVGRGVEIQQLPERVEQQHIVAAVEPQIRRGRCQQRRSSGARSGIRAAANRRGGRGEARRMARRQNQQRLRLGCSQQRRCASSTIGSSSGCVLPATHTARPGGIAARAAARRARRCRPAGCDRT